MGGGTCGRPVSGTPDGLENSAEVKSQLNGTLVDRWPSSPDEVASLLGANCCFLTGNCVDAFSPFVNNV